MLVQLLARQERMGFSAKKLSKFLDVVFRSESVYAISKKFLFKFAAVIVICALSTYWDFATLVHAKI